MMSQCTCCYNYTIPGKVEDAVAYICPVCLWQNDVYTVSADEPSYENIKSN